MSICNLLLALSMVVALGAPIAQATGARYQPAGADNPPATSVQRPGHPSAPAHATGRLQGGAADRKPGDARPQAMRNAGTVSPAARARLVQSYGRLPLSFEINRGQTDPRVSFVARGSGYTLFLTATGATLALAQPQAQTAHGTARLSGSDHLGQRSGATRGASILPSLHLPVNLDPLHGLPAPRSTEQVVQLRYIGANPHPRMVGMDKLPGIVNYFIGKDPHKWHTNIPTYARVAYRNVYPGIDLAYYGHQGQLEYDWIVAPGARPSAIRLAVTGGQGVRLDTHGNLLVGSGTTLLRQLHPVVYQVVRGARQPVQASYQLVGHGLVHIQVGAYDHAKSLVIDPVLSYGTYLGGGSYDYGYGLAVDQSGNAYVTGETYGGFPVTPGAFQTSAFGYDAYIAKLNPSGTGLVYSTYLGGTTSETSGNGIAVDGQGDAYVTGFTSTNSFPATTGAYQQNNKGDIDAFVTELNPSGTGLLYSTYLGGSRDDEGEGIAVDGQGHAYVIGYTASTDFPTKLGSYETSPLGTADYFFVAELYAGGTDRVYSTYLGCGAGSIGFGITIDSQGNAYIAGDESCSSFPFAPGAYQSPHPGTPDVVVAKLNAGGASLAYAARLGGSNVDEPYGIAVDGQGDAYVTGYTVSTDFATTSGAYQTVLESSQAAFVTELNPTGSSLKYSTLLGGNEIAFGGAIAVDGQGDAYVAGGIVPTYSVDGSILMDELNTTGTGLLSDTRLLGNAGESGHSIALDGRGNIYVVGTTSSTYLPGTPGAVQRGLNGPEDAFVVKLTYGAFGPVPWHPHYDQRFASGLSASVDLEDGSTTISADDMSIPARGPDLALTHR